ncbi:hypothetical protein GPECTOR_13g715 [Gonium pectorale]|uniref:Uncharacterized protein n=1 Tax=Gonium pectorale TaxID=33097 RepID=A0A150GN71_GONPE|nr:hypothetical protein GPECTOR_13g715 [Gonium pectorale]|eukprot:KXZ51228.1 hypothetical protein GPECTOR_13g715 [Gonium pectorale]
MLLGEVVLLLDALSGIVAARLPELGDMGELQIELCSGPLLEHLCQLTQHLAALPEARQQLAAQLSRIGHALSMLFSRPAPAPAAAGPPPLAPLQPCLQFLLTSHVVALCCAVDGDRQSYGLPAVLGGSDPPTHPAAAGSAASYSWSDAVPAASAALPLFTPDGAVTLGATSIAGGTSDAEETEARLSAQAVVVAAAAAAAEATSGKVSAVSGAADTALQGKDDGAVAPAPLQLPPLTSSTHPQLPPLAPAPPTSEAAADAGAQVGKQANVWDVFCVLSIMRRAQHQMALASHKNRVRIASCDANMASLRKSICNTERTVHQLGAFQTRGSATASALRKQRANMQDSWEQAETCEAELRTIEAEVLATQRLAESISETIQPCMDCVFWPAVPPGNHLAVHALCVRLARAALRAWDPHSATPRGTAAEPVPSDAAGCASLGAGPQTDSAASADGGGGAVCSGAAVTPAAAVAATPVEASSVAAAPGDLAPREPHVTAAAPAVPTQAGGPAGSVLAVDGGGADSTPPMGASPPGEVTPFRLHEMREAVAPAASPEVEAPAELSVSSPPAAVLPPSEVPPLLHAALRCARASALGAVEQRALTKALRSAAGGAAGEAAMAGRSSTGCGDSASQRRGLAARRAEWWCLALRAAEASAAAIKSPWADAIRSDLLAWVYECLVGADCDAGDSGAAGGRGGGGGSGGLKVGGGHDGGAGAGEGPSTGCRQVSPPVPPALVAPTALPSTPRPDVVAAHSAGWLPAVTRLMRRAKEQLGAAASSGAVAGQAAFQSASAAASSTTTSAGASTASAASAGVGYAAASAAAPSQPLHLPIAVLRPRVMEGWPLAWAEALAFAPSREDAAALLEAAAELLEAAVAVVQETDGVAAGAGPGATETERDAATAAVLLSLDWQQLRAAVAAVRPLLSVVPGFACWRSGELLTQVASAVAAASVGFDGAKAADATPGADASGGRGSALPPEGPLVEEASAGAEEAEVEARCVPGPGDVTTTDSGCGGSAGTVHAQQTFVAGDGSGDSAGGNLAEPTAPLPPLPPPPVATSPPAAADAREGGLCEGTRPAPGPAAPAAAASQLAWLIDRAASRLRPAFDRAVLTLAGAPRAG